MNITKEQLAKLPLATFHQILFLLGDETPLPPIPLEVWHHVVKHIPDVSTALVLFKAFPNLKLSIQASQTLTTAFYHQFIRYERDTLDWHFYYGHQLLLAVEPRSREEGVCFRFMYQLCIMSLWKTNKYVSCTTFMDVHRKVYYISDVWDYYVDKLDSLLLLDNEDLVKRDKLLLVRNFVKGLLPLYDREKRCFPDAELVTYFYQHFPFDKFIGMT